MAKYILLCLLFFSVVSLNAQDTLHGNIVAMLGKADDLQPKPLAGVRLQWLGTNDVVYSNPLGDFTLVKNTQTDKLIVTHAGFITDTVTVEFNKMFLQIKLYKSSTKQLATISTSGQRRTTEISYLSVTQMLKLKEGELLKAACCNLSESFETTPSVDVNFTDAITGKKQIQMLGLATPNTLITQENIPNIRGLASTVGLHNTPGTWVQEMQLSKGTGSVVNGFEGLAGQINIELKKPDNCKEQYYLNVYQNTAGRAEANFNLMNEFSATTAGGILLHHKNQFATTDHNRDGFIDNPREAQSAAVLRAQYFGKNGLEVQGIGKVVDTKERSFTTSQNAGVPLWQMQQHTARQELSLKFGKLYTDKPWKSMGLQVAGFKHQQNLNTTTKKYTGQHDNIYMNYIYQTTIGNSNHGIKLGGSFLYDAYEELLPIVSLGLLQRTEKVPGVFAEHSYTYLDKFNIITGLRVDAHNLFGTFITPRLHIRYAPRYGTVLRASVGKARRTVSLLTENQAVYFTNRIFKLQGMEAIWQKGLFPEIAWNFGTSLTQDYKLNYRKGTFVLDYYYTHFVQQWIADYETPRQIEFYSNHHNSFAHAIQATTDYEIIRKRLDIRIAYKFYNVQNTYRGVQLQKPLQPRHRGFINLAYQTKNKWAFDATANYNGSRRLPNYFATASDIAFSNQYSPAFFTYNAHVSKEIKKNIEVYAGGENLSNFMQHNAIISFNNPTGSDFDAAQIWGPVMGINVYVGFRWKGSWENDE